ncbi:hypothetical protein CAter10_4379 [Collimonas arenae]|nr:hypothetical protein CAter10_4379 [Collimonas arenae]
MQNHSADQLNVEMAHFQDPLAGFPANRKCFRQQVVKLCTVGNPLLEFWRFSLQLGISQLFESWLKRVDLADDFLYCLSRRWLRLPKIWVSNDMLGF